MRALFSRDCHEVAFQLQFVPSAPTFSVLVQQKEEAKNYPEPRGANSNRPNLDGHIRAGVIADVGLVLACRALDTDLFDELMVCRLMTRRATTSPPGKAHTIARAKGVTSEISDCQSN